MSADTNTGTSAVGWQTLLTTPSARQLTGMAIYLNPADYPSLQQKLGEWYLDLQANLLATPQWNNYDKGWLENDGLSRSYALFTSASALSTLQYASSIIWRVRVNWKAGGVAWECAISHV